jgi:hypothetical protein
MVPMRDRDPEMLQIRPAVRARCATSVRYQTGTGELGAKTMMAYLLPRSRIFGLTPK